MEPEQVCGSWVHAHEEDTGDGTVFRPVGTPMPPARGRTTLELRADGTYSEIGPGPDDVPRESTGTWSVREGRITLTGDTTSSADRELEVVAADPDRLVVRRSREPR